MIVKMTGLGKVAEVPVSLRPVMDSLMCIPEGVVVAHFPPYGRAGLPGDGGVYTLEILDLKGPKVKATCKLPGEELLEKELCGRQAVAALVQYRTWRMMWN